MAFSGQWKNLHREGNQKLEVEDSALVLAEDWTVHTKEDWEMEGSITDFPGLERAGILLLFRMSGWGYLCISWARIRGKPLCAGIQREKQVSNRSTKLDLILWFGMEQLQEEKQQMWGPYDIPLKFWEFPEVITKWASFTVIVFPRMLNCSPWRYFQILARRQMKTEKYKNWSWWRVYFQNFRAISTNSKPR